MWKRFEKWIALRVRSTVILSGWFLLGVLLGKFPMVVVLPFVIASLLLNLDVLFHSPRFNRWFPKAEWLQTSLAGWSCRRILLALALGAALSLLLQPPMMLFLLGLVVWGTTWVALGEPWE